MRELQSITFRKTLEREKMSRDKVTELGKDWAMKDLECHPQEFSVHPEIWRAAMEGLR